MRSSRVDNRRRDVRRGFSFFYQPDSLWTGWISGSDVSLRGVTDVLAPQSFCLSGPADFKLEGPLGSRKLEAVQHGERETAQNGQPHGPNPSGE